MICKLKFYYWSNEPTFVLWTDFPFLRFASIECFWEAIVNGELDIDRAVALDYDDNVVEAVNHRM